MRLSSLTWNLTTQRDTVKSVKRLLGDKEVDQDIVAVLLKLDRLTQYEHLNAAVQTLGVVSGEQPHSACNLLSLNTLLSRCPGRPLYVFLVIKR